MLSSTKSRESAPDDLSGTMVQVIDILLHSIQVHSVAIDPAAFAAFQAEIQKVRGIVRMTSPEQILSTAAFIQRTVEAYSQGAVRVRRAH